MQSRRTGRPGLDAPPRDADSLRSVLALLPGLGDDERTEQPAAVRRTLTPRDAAFAFRSARMTATPTALTASLSEGLAQATARDCLDAAFASPRPRDLIRAAQGASPPAPPFRDSHWCAALAAWLGCPYEDGDRLPAEARADGARSLIREDGALLRVTRDGRTVVALAPAPAWLPALAATIARRPEVAERIVIVPHQAIVAAVPDAGPVVVRGRVEPLHDVPGPEVADRVITRPQVIAFAATLVSLVALAATAPGAALNAAVAVLTLVLIGYAASRGLALFGGRRTHPPRKPLRSAELPDYTVLLPLYKEDEGIAHLVRSLRRLDYPSDKLDIQFLVEEDDAVTQNAIRREASALPCRVIIVPAGVPRTKPRALNAGLRQARGSLVTIFDAEDRPDPNQLRIAAETFAAAPPELAALQARLSIDHLEDNWLTTMFAVEYACLFDHVLPTVSSHGRMLLLGGTSNHFRTTALLEAGGWDPYNVTEDADLAVRLRRCGYRLAMIDSETHEEAPLTADAWLKQRSRWFKGYIQTWLVHNRRPLELVRAIGWADTLVLHLFIVGALAAALAHLAFTAQLALYLTGLSPALLGGSPLVVGLQTLAVVFGYGTSFTLGLISVRRDGRARIPARAVLWFPLYWILMGGAVCLAIHDLIRRPHHWRKTAHGLAVRPGRSKRGDKPAVPALRASRVA